MNVWLISDTHFGHENIAEYCGRPVDHERRLLTAMQRIPKSDLLIHLGDVSLGKQDDFWHNTLKSTVVCQRWLVRGNHDRQSFSWYMERGWGVVCESLQFERGGKNILFTHVPRHRHPTDTWDVNIHGHFHNKSFRVAQMPGYKPEDHLLVNIETKETGGTGFDPVKLDRMLSHPVDYRVRLIDAAMLGMTKTGL